jgi:hypothetical protein
VGKIIHAIQKEAVNFCDKNLQEAADYIDNELPKAMGRTDLQPEIIRAGRFLAKELRQFGGREVLLYEKPITASLFPATAQRGEVLIVTEPDLLLATQQEDTVLMPDTKTGWLDRTAQEAQDDFQTCVGSFCVWERYPAINRIGWFYLNVRKNTTSKAWVIRERDYDAFKARIEQAAKLWLDKCEDAWPQEKKCSWCPVIRWCKYAEPICKELDGDPKTFIDNTIVLKELLKKRQKVLTEATKNGRRLYGSETFCDGTPQKKSPHRASFKKLKAEETKDEDETE